MRQESIALILHLLVQVFQKILNLSCILFLWLIKLFPLLLLVSNSSKRAIGQIHCLHWPIILVLRCAFYYSLFNFVNGECVQRVEQDFLLVFILAIALDISISVIEIWISGFLFDSYHKHQVPCKFFACFPVSCGWQKSQVLYNLANVLLVVVELPVVCIGSSIAGYFKELLFFI